MWAAASAAFACAIRSIAGNAAALAARCRNRRRGISMFSLPAGSDAIKRTRALARKEAALRLMREPRGRGEEPFRDARRLAQGSRGPRRRAALRPLGRRRQSRLDARSRYRGGRRRRGRVVVTEVDPSGPAAEHGLKTGDRILEIGGKKVTSPAKSLMYRRCCGRVLHCGNPPSSLHRCAQSDPGTRSQAMLHCSGPSPAPHTIRPTQAPLNQRIVQ
jgi:hypothetical protein